jgi:hypothetical protein
MARRSRGWQADVHWRAVNGMNHTTVTLDTPPEPFGVFTHPDVADGHRMQITALSIDQRGHQLRIDLTDRPPRRAAPPSPPE